MKSPSLVSFFKFQFKKPKGFHSTKFKLSTTFTLLLLIPNLFLSIYDAPPASALAGPTTITCSSVSSTSVKCNWSTVATATGYQLVARPGSNTIATNLTWADATNGPKSTTVTLKQLLPTHSPPPFLV